MEVTRLFDFAHYQLKHFPQQKCVNGSTASYSTEELIQLANKVSMGLLQIGVQPGDKIALICYENRPEWNAMDLGILQIGAVNVPVYPTISADDYEYIFNDSEVTYCFVGGGDLLEKVKTAQPKIPSLKEVFTFDENPDAPHWTTIFSNEGMDRVEERMAAVKTDDMATIIYTSGTTGKPKGVMLSHNNIASNVLGVKKIMPITEGQQALSFLPICHIFERTVFYTYLSLGIPIYYSSIENLRDNLGVVKPYFFTTVPRLLEKVYERIYTTAVNKGGLAKKIFLWALSLTDDFEYDKSYSGLAALKRRIADKIVFSKIRARLGGNIRGIFTGSAACPVKMARFFSAAGVPIREGYGLTETSPGLTLNGYKPYEALLGTVGTIIDNVSIKIDTSDGGYAQGEGEILAKGPNIMLGYYRKPDKTAEVIDADGWFHTGDIGKLVKNSKGTEFLKITDRKKELLKTSGGKYIAPTPIENKFKEDFLIEQMIVLGNNEKFCSALIVPAFESLKTWCEENGVAWTSTEEVCKNEKVIAYYKACVGKFNPLFSKVEQVKEFRLVPKPWDVSTGELTPTMKLKRKVIMERHKDLIESIYS